MENLTKRFLNYISFDTKSDPDKGETQKPSTEESCHIEDQYRRCKRGRIREIQ